MARMATSQRGRERSADKAHCRQKRRATCGCAIEPCRPSSRAADKGKHVVALLFSRRSSGLANCAPRNRPCPRCRPRLGMATLPINRLRPSATVQLLRSSLNLFLIALMQRPICLLALAPMLRTRFGLRLPLHRPLLALRLQPLNLLNMICPFPAAGSSQPPRHCPAACCAWHPHRRDSLASNFLPDMFDPLLPGSPEPRLIRAVPTSFLQTAAAPILAQQRFPNSTPIRTLRARTSTEQNCSTTPAAHAFTPLMLSNSLLVSIHDLPSPKPIALLASLPRAQLLASLSTCFLK